MVFEVTEGTRDTATVVAAREDARAREGLTAEAMPYVPASSAPLPPDSVDPRSAVWAEAVSGGSYTHRRLARGTRVRLTDPTGDACAHLLVFNAAEPHERLNVADTQKIPWQAYLGEGHPLLSGDGRVLATIVSDTSMRHDAFCGTSTALSNDARYGGHDPQNPTPAGRELFALAATKHGLERRDLPPSISFFQGVRVAHDGALEFTGSAGSDTYVELVAEMDLILLIANVPHPLDPRERYTVGPLRVHAWQSSPTSESDPWWNTTPECHRAYLNTADYLASKGY